MRLLAVDPGLATTGWAFFRGEVPAGGTLSDALRLLDAHGRRQTTTDDPDHLRLHVLSSWAVYITENTRPDTVVVEVPAIAGQYARHGAAQRKGVNRLYMAIGALLAGFGRAAGHTLEAPPAIVQAPAIRESKETRTSMLEHTAGIIDMELPSGPRGGVRQNVLDAIWLGCEHLL